ncbi:MAG: RNA polymerase subunit sigma, partial [Phycisphaerae bacterium]|nr:RNA polymerase subunit sigma [Phycisphaerae bacterium]
MLPEPADATRILARARTGDADAAQELFALLYAELRALAGRLMEGERAEHTLQPTALVHEAWMRLADAGAPTAAEDRRHFVRLAARAMRHTLVDHARARG